MMSGCIESMYLDALKLELRSPPGKESNDGDLVRYIMKIPLPAFGTASSADLSVEACTHEC